ncbi:MAG: hypothetical protein IT345_10595 [Trueperaceae bacterium]|nr:hypothetical protein [Trueperaceae bacterium]
MPADDDVGSSRSQGYGPSLEQAFRNHVKVARAAIRLKHSIAADNELAVLLPALKVRLEAGMQEGRIPELTIADLLAMVEGE